MYEIDLTVVGDNAIAITRLFDAPRELVWRCHTEPALVKRWLGVLPGWTFPVCEIDLRVGGRYRYLWRSPEGNDMGMSGAYTEIAEPQRLGSTAIFDEDWTGGETRNVIVLEQKGSRTLLTQTVRYANNKARDLALSTPMAEGMQTGYRRLDEVLREEQARG